MKKQLCTFIIFFITPFIFSQNDNIEITFKRKADNSVDFFYSKKQPGSYTLKLEFTTLENSYSSSVHTKVLKYNSGRICTITPSDKNKGISFGYKTTYRIGNSNPSVNTDIIYTLPFLEDKNLTIMEASFIEETYFGNKKPLGWKAFVAITKTPDTICSMRKGTVVKIINEYENDSTLLKVYTSKRNEITIEHKDGTYAKYVGFDKNKILVKLGQVVYPQTRLGVLEIFNKNMHRLDFFVFHYSNDILEQQEKQTLNNADYKMQFLNPLFLTDKGSVEIVSGQDYKALFNKAILLQELSRKERKTFKKDPKFYH